MMLIRCLTVLLLASASLTAAKHRHGFLDRLVAHHKKQFLDELSRLPSPLTVTVEKAPPGFVDSPHWDEESVLRLVMLVEVLDVKPVRHAIRRALSPFRRSHLPPGKNSFDIFPSWGKLSPNDFEYDDMVNYDDKSPAPLPLDPLLTDDTVIYISNPVEAHLPSSRVTVKLLREIMEERAVGLRAMPTTKPSTRSWKPKNVTTTPSPAGNATAGSTVAPEGNTTARAAEGSTAAGDAAAGNATAAGAEGSTGAGSTAEGGANGTGEATGDSVATTEHASSA